MKHIVCFSGGHSSALVAIEVVRKFGAKDVVLLNHNISSQVESADVKCFKQQIADYLGLKIAYANHVDYENMTPIKVCLKAGTWVNPANRQILCTHRLKTAPFYDWLSKNYESGDAVYYGFDKNEQHRITRRSAIMGQLGYATDYPLALWSRTIASTLEVGIEPPTSYGLFNHANCTGCLKGGWQHWYVVYCHYPHIWRELIDAEETIGFSVHQDSFAEDKSELFEQMKKAGILATEKIPSGEFWSSVRRALGRIEQEKSQISLFDLPTLEQSVECTGDCKI